MKKIFYTAIFAICGFLTASCDDVLNIPPTDRFSDVWSSQEAVEQYVTGFYAYVRENTEIGSTHMTGFTDAYSDLIKSSSWSEYNHSYNVALLQETTFTSDDAGPFSCWSDSYGRIRRQNEFLRDAPKHADKFGADYINEKMAEVRFIRAYAYYRLIRVYGPVVLRTEVDGPAQNDKSRASEAQSWQQVIDDLNYAATYLPETQPRGKVTKAAAYAMLTRVGLFAKRWDVAVKAAEDLKALKGVSDLAECLDGNYANIFNSIDSKENIMTVEFLPGYLGSISHQADAYFRPKGDAVTHGTGGANVVVYSAFGPTSELVDSYEMSDGTPFSWKEHGDDPYTGRDPRFYATILYNGAMWEGRKIETCKGGADAISEFTTSNSANSSVTGYYLRKWITEDDKTWEKNASSHFAIVLRYGEVLLNYAEALAEADWAANSSAALAALNAVRNRAGLPGKTAAGKDEFMEHIRHERIVELAGEGFRYWDLRRWKLAEDVIHGSQVHGVLAKDNGDGTFSYEQVEVDAGRTRVFYNRYYAFSLPQTEISNNGLIGMDNNNPGW